MKKRKTRNRYRISDELWKKIEPLIPKHTNTHRFGGGRPREKTGPNPTDRAKKGVKRSLLTEACGVPIGLAIDGANRHDSKMVEATIESIAVERPEPTEQEPQGMPLDKAYDSGEVRDLVKEFGYTAHIRTRGEEAHCQKVVCSYPKFRRWSLANQFFFTFHNGFNRNSCKPGFPK